ncbi:hypothetical protein HRbin26_00175 [bacterium HR26]|nr:hypothetical protein HRbin26_00175 [bacterium HR26]
MDRRAAAGGRAGGRSPGGDRPCPGYRGRRARRVAGTAERYPTRADRWHQWGRSGHGDRIDDPGIGSAGGAGQRHRRPRAGLRRYSARRAAGSGLRLAHPPFSAGAAGRTGTRRGDGGQRSRGAGRLRARRRGSVQAGGGGQPAALRSRLPHDGCGRRAGRGRRGSLAADPRCGDHRPRHLAGSLDGRRAAGAVRNDDQAAARRAGGRERRGGGAARSCRVHRGRERAGGAARLLQRLRWGLRRGSRARPARQPLEPARAWRLAQAVPLRIADAPGHRRHARPPARARRAPRAGRIDPGRSQPAHAERAAARHPGRRAAGKVQSPLRRGRDPARPGGRSGPVHRRAGATARRERAGAPRPGRDRP